MARPLRPLRSGRRLLLGSFIPFFILSLIWAFTMPRFSGDEEIAHTIHAASVVTHGPFGVRTVDPSTNKPEGTFMGHPSIAGTSWIVEVPKSFDRIIEERCYLQGPHMTPHCAPELPFKGGTIREYTPVGGYAPLWALLSGLPGLLFPPVTSLYLVRILHALVVATMLHIAVRSLWRMYGVRMIAPFVVLLAPTVFVLGSGAGPVGIMIAGAIAVWASASAFAQCGWDLEGRVLVLSAFVTSLTTPFAPWLVALLILVALLHGVPMGDVRRRVRIGGYTAPFLGSLAAVVAGISWNLIADAYTIPFPKAPLVGTNQDVLRATLLHIPTRISELFSTLGNQLIDLPKLPISLWLIAMAALLLVGFFYGDIVDREAITILGLATIGIPIIVDMMTAQTSGLAWSGVYMWPTFGAMMMVCINVYAREDLTSTMRTLMVVLWTIPIIPMHITTWTATMARFTHGITGSDTTIWAWPTDPLWLPPLNATTLVYLLALIVSYAVVTATLELWPAYVMRWSRRPLPDEAG